MATPGPPLPFSAPVQIASGALRFLWTAPVPCDVTITTYELSVFAADGREAEREYRLHASALQFLIPGNEMYYDVTGLTNGVSYTGTIKASSDYGATWGPEASFAPAIPVGPPPAPVGHAAAYRTAPTTASVVWTQPTAPPPAAAPAYYYIETVSDTAGDEVLANKTADLATFRLTLSGLRATSTYTVKVYVKNAVGQSAPFTTNRF